MQGKSFTWKEFEIDVFYHFFLFYSQMNLYIVKKKGGDFSVKTKNCYIGSFDCSVEGGKLVVGMPNTIRLRYTAGAYGIDDGGTVCFVQHGVTDWQKINLEDTTALGYTTVRSNADVKLIVSTNDGMRPYETEIQVKVRDGCLKEGDYIEILMGDTSEGSLGIITQTVAEKRHLFFVRVDPIGSGRFELAGEAKYVQVNCGEIADYDIILPSSAIPGQQFDVKLRVLDDYGNRCEGFIGNVEICKTEGIQIDALVTLTKEDRGCKTIHAVIEKEGVYVIESKIQQYGLSKRSNPCKTINGGERKLFWGDMHGQNALASGIGDMNDTFEFTKDVAAIDFTGWQGNDFEVSDLDWEKVKEAISRHNKENDFVVFNGYEWSGITANGGDHNIYFSGDDCQIRRSSSWLWKDDQTRIPNGKNNVETDCNNIMKLWKTFEGRNDVMAIPHVGGRHANFDYYNPLFTKVIEVYSHHGIFEWFMNEAIKRHMKVGFIAASDDHTSRVGLSYPMGTNGDIGATFDVKSGLTAVYAKELSREGIWEAINQRHCYAATSARMILEFSCNGYEMGDEFNTSEYPKLCASVYTSGPLNRIELYRDLEKIKTIKIGCKNEENSKRKIKISWSGVRTKFRKKSVRWDGSIYLKGGMIVDAENYSVDNSFEGVMGYNRHVVNFKSKTSGDEDGIILTIETSKLEECEVLFTSLQGNAVVKLNELMGNEKIIKFGEVDRQVVFSVEEERQSTYEGILEYEDREVKEGENFYYIKAFQDDGNRLWSSPIFINYSKKIQCREEEENE